MREKKRLLPALLTIAMLLTVMPGTVYAAELPPNPEGTTINGIAYGDSMYANYGTINGVSGTLTVPSLFFGTNSTLLVTGLPLFIICAPSVL